MSCDVGVMWEDVRWCGGDMGGYRVMWGDVILSGVIWGDVM